MTMPLKKRPLLNEESQQCLEINAVFLLAHMLKPPLILMCAPVDAGASIADSPEPSCRPFTPEPVVVMVTPPTSPPTSPLPSPPPPTLRSPIAQRSCGRSSSLPTANDPGDDSFCMQLYSPGEEGLINPTHIAIRRQVLEIRRTQSGKVYFQCGCCAHLPRGERGAKYSTIAPTSLKNLYHAFIRFMMYHVPACPHIPQEIKELQPPSATKDVKASGIKKYWRVNAIAKGLRDSDNGRGIIYEPS